MSVWIWDGSAWTEWSGPGPAARSDLGMATFDGRVVLSGGVGDDGAPLDDTWLWDGSSWTELTGPHPPARSGAAMASFSLLIPG